MKWNDGRGRIGGVLHVFDCAALLAAAFLGLYFWLLDPRLIPPPRGMAATPVRTTKRPVGVMHRPRPVIIRDLPVVFRNLEPGEVRLIQGGDRDTTHPQTVAHIVGVVSVDPEVRIVNLAPTRLRAEIPEGKKRVRVRMRLEGQLIIDGFLYKGRLLTPGRLYRFTTPEYTQWWELLDANKPWSSSNEPSPRDAHAMSWHIRSPGIRTFVSGVLFQKAFGPEDRRRWDCGLNVRLNGPESEAPCSTR